MDLGTILSGPIGAIFGAAGSVVGKVLDYKMKKLDQDHELKLRDKDRELAQLEFQQKSELARVEADQAIAIREVDAFAASVTADRAAYGDSPTGRIVDLVRGLIRPVITAVAMVLVTYMTVKSMNGGSLEHKARVDLLNEALFLAGTAIAWWFGTRSSFGKAAPARR